MSLTENPYIITNLSVFYEIAKDTYAQSMLELEKNRTPKTNGGYVISYDPERKSFKNSLISISFSGSYLDLHLKISYFVKFKELPPKSWRMNNPYLKKLKSLGIDDKNIASLCEKFSTARNDVSHETPIIEGLESRLLHETAQDGAKVGIDLIETVRIALPIMK